MNEHALITLMRETATAAGQGPPVSDVLSRVVKARNIRWARGTAVTGVAVIAVVATLIGDPRGPRESLTPATPPDPTPAATPAPGSDGPELGTTAVPDAVRRAFDAAGLALATSRSTVLARTTDDAEYVLHGVATADGASCAVATAAQADAAGVVLGWTCESGAGRAGVLAERFTGAMSTSVIVGSAPPGAVTASLAGPARVERIQMYAGGSGWHHRTFFIAPWPPTSSAELLVTDSTGEPLGRAVMSAAEDRD